MKITHAAVVITIFTFPSFSHAAIVGDDVDFSGALGAQSETIGASVEFLQDFTAFYSGGTVGDQIDLYDGGFTLSLWNNSDADLTWEPGFGDTWTVSDINDVIDPAAIVTDVTQISGLADHIFDISFGADTFTITPNTAVNMPIGASKSYDFSLTLSSSSVPAPVPAWLIGLGLGGLIMLRRRKFESRK